MRAKPAFALVLPRTSSAHLIQFEQDTAAEQSKLQCTKIPHAQKNCISHIVLKDNADRKSS
eukprot:3065800-Amphidinium_carterae.1